MRFSPTKVIVATFAFVGPPVGTVCLVTVPLAFVALTSGEDVAYGMSEALTAVTFLLFVGYACGFVPAFLTGLVMAGWSGRATTENWVGRAAGMGFLISCGVAAAAWAIFIGTSSAGVGPLQLAGGALTVGPLVGIVGAAAAAICAALTRKTRMRT